MPEETAPREGQNRPRRRLRGWVAGAALLLAGVGAFWMFVWVPYCQMCAARDALGTVGASAVAEVRGPEWCRFLNASGLLEAIVEVQFQDGSLTGIDEHHYRRGLQGLERLFLFNADLTAEDARLLRELPNLQMISVTNGQVADAALAAMARMPSLRSVYLHNARTSDEDLVQLARLGRLQELGVTQSPVTDAGLEPLKAVPLLTVLNLGHTQVTARGVNSLKEALPECTVFYK